MRNRIVFRGSERKRVTETEFLKPQKNENTPEENAVVSDNARKAIKDILKPINDTKKLSAIKADENDTSPKVELSELLEPTETLMELCDQLLKD